MTKDIAEFFSLAVGTKVLPAAVTIEWADSIIMSEDLAPEWAFDVSLAKAPTAKDALNDLLLRVRKEVGNVA